ncbi:phage tail protein [Candidatus Pantoea formicae]|uniref:phage tail protein n=1 Tax=Candidatus Pantoea formicae TaxID=2608355 RepID=UPI003ED91FAC
MPIYQAGSLNTAALSAPDLYVQIVPPSTRYINGVPTDGLGLVGVASWGPVNRPFHITSDTDMAFFLGPPQNRQYDLATAVAVSLQTGATNLNCVRVTNGSEKAACGEFSHKKTKKKLCLTALYSGTRGNLIKAGLSRGSAAKSIKLTISLPGVFAEVFDNLSTEVPDICAVIADAVNHGQHAVRGPSQLILAGVEADESTTTSNVAVVIDHFIRAETEFSGGNDGIEQCTVKIGNEDKAFKQVSDSEIMGADSAEGLRTGMYALRSTGSQVINLIDVATAEHWPAMTAFAQSEGAFIISQGAESTDFKALSDALNQSGVDDWHLKLLVGDWPYWKDTTNGINRLIAPATFEAANIAARSPHISTLNKSIPGIIATQRQLDRRIYTGTEIGLINAARLDVITNPCPGGNYFGMRSGRNCSSNPTQNDDTYTRMTNFLSLTIAASFGSVVGDNQTVDLRRETKSTLESFLSNLETLKMIGNPNGGPAFAVRLDETNNPDSRVALGYMTADVKVKYLNVVRFFMVNLEGGGSVSISVSNH